MFQLERGHTLGRLDGAPRHFVHGGAADVDEDARATLAQERRFVDEAVHAMPCGRSR
jgi:hypothetical protein